MKKPKTKRKGEEMLLAAALRNHYNVLRQLLQHGVDPNTATISSSTPQRSLSNAAKMGATASVLVLLRSPRTKFDMVDAEGRNLFHWCCKRGHHETLNAVLSHFQEFPPFREIMTPVGKLRKTFPTIQEILRAKDASGRTCLMLASWSGHSHIVQTLQQILTVIDQNVHDSLHGWTPLQGACMYGQNQTARILVSVGADVHVADKRQNSPLHLASRRGSVEIVNCLLENGASWDVFNDMGYTPLHLASLNGHHGVITAIVAFAKKQGKLANLYKIVPRFDKIFGRSVLGLAEISGKDARAKTIACVKETTSLIFSDYNWHQQPA